MFESNHRTGVVSRVDGATFVRDSHHGSGTYVSSYHEGVPHAICQRLRSVSTGFHRRLLSSLQATSSLTLLVLQSPLTDDEQRASSGLRNRCREPLEQIAGQRMLQSPRDGHRELAHVIYIRRRAEKCERSILSAEPSEQ